jgi:hypothetical protein
VWQWRYSSTILDLGTRWRCRFTPGTHWRGSWVAPEPVWTRCREPNTGRSARSPWLYGLSYPGYFPAGAKRTKRETDHSPPSGAEVLNAWNYTSTPPRLQCAETTLTKLAPRTILLSEILSVFLNSSFSFHPVFSALLHSSFFHSLYL